MSHTRILNVTYDSRNLWNQLFDDLHIALVLVVSQVHVNGLERIVMRGQGSGTEGRGEASNVGTLIRSGGWGRGGDDHGEKADKDEIGPGSRNGRAKAKNGWKEEKEEWTKERKVKGEVKGEKGRA